MYDFYFNLFFMNSKRKLRHYIKLNISLKQYTFNSGKNRNRGTFISNIRKLGNIHLISFKLSFQPIAEESCLLVKTLI